MPLKRPDATKLIARLEFIHPPSKTLDEDDDDTKTE